MDRRSARPRNPKWTRAMLGMILTVLAGPGYAEHGVVLKEATVHSMAAATVTARAAPAPRVTTAPDACPATQSSACAAYIDDCARNAVVKLRVTFEDGSTHLCTGATVDSDREFTQRFERPYVVTAAVCVPDQRTADTIETHWYEQSAGCGEEGLRPQATVTTGGAELIARDPSTGIALLELRDAAPPGGACLLQWPATPAEFPAQEAQSDTAHTVIFQPASREDTAQRVAPARLSSISSLLVTGTAETLAISVIAATWAQGSAPRNILGAPLLARNELGDWGIMGTYVHYFGRHECTQGGAFARMDVFAQNRAYRYLGRGPEPEDDHAGVPDNATALAPGERGEGRIDNAHDVDLFAIDIEESGTLVVHTTGEADLTATLEDAQAKLITLNDDGSLRKNARVSAELEPGRVYLRIAAHTPRTTSAAYTVLPRFTAQEDIPSARLNFLPAARQGSPHGFIRVSNIRGVGAEKTIDIFGIDDEGNRAGPVRLYLGDRESIQMNSRDLAEGNAEKRLQDGLGEGEGHWRLEFHSSDGDLVVGAYVRNTEGLLAPVHDEAPYHPAAGNHYLAMVNPASNTINVSTVRFVNMEPDREVTVEVVALSDAGGETALVRLRIAPGASRNVTVRELEEGSPDIEGALGDGTGKWRMSVEADGDIRVMSLVRSVNGHLANLSTAR